MSQEVEGIVLKCWKRAKYLLESSTKSELELNEASAANERTPSGKIESDKSLSANSITALSLKITNTFYFQLLEENSLRRDRESAAETKHFRTNQHLFSAYIYVYI